MFWSKRNSKRRLQKQYEKLLTEAHSLSHSNRQLSDRKHAEAEQLAIKLDQLDKSASGSKEAIA